MQDQKEYAHNMQTMPIPFITLICLRVWGPERRTHFTEESRAPFVGCQATSTLKLTIGGSACVCVCVCAWSLPVCSPTLHSPSESFAQCLPETRGLPYLAKPVLSGWSTLRLIKFWTPSGCPPLHSNASSAFEKCLRNGTKFNQPLSVLCNKLKPEPQNILWLYLGDLIQK